MTQLDSILEQVVATHGITKAMVAYGRAADRGRTDLYVAQFVEDGVLEIIGETFDAGRYEGRHAIFERIEQSKRDLADGYGSTLLRHYLTNIDVDLDTPTVARAGCYWMAVTDGGPDHWGRYRDVMVRGDDGAWRFRHRQVIHEGYRPGSWIETANERLRNAS
ncbi:MAG: nuclear transport factor 2 family protein [Microthrixaceae bacterium]